MADNAIVILEKVEKRFGSNTGLQGISMRIQRGDFVILLGRNGAGKSSLLRVLAQLIRPNSGEVKVFGMDIRHKSESIREKIGFVAHNTLLYLHLTARENLRFYAKLYELNGADGEVQSALKEAGLEFNADRPVRGFSRGMQQRLAIARATLHQPELLLLDEPFSGLDLEAAELLSERLQQWVAAGRTIIMATHALEQGLRDVTRWVLLEKGQIVEEFRGDVTSVRSHYRQFLQGVSLSIPVHKI